MTHLLTLTILPPSDFDSYWSIIVQVLLLCALLLLANTIRRKVKFIQKALIPTSIIAGFLGLGVKYLLNNALKIQIDGAFLITSDFMSIVTYHMIAIGFIALGLKGSEKIGKVRNIKQVNPAKSGLLIVTTYMLQGIVGLLITIIAALVFTDVAAYSGVLLPMGYGQGPGQANNIGMLYEGAGFIGGRSFGLTISTMGFISAAVGGVIYLNIMVRQGKIKRIERTDSNKPPLTSIVEGSDEIPVVESVDKMSVQMAIVGLVYLISWLFMFGLTSLLAVLDTNPTGGFLTKSVIPLIWGFNFIVATFMTILVKKFVIIIKKLNLMRRTYTNDFMLNRIAGVAFDFMIIASITAIDIEMISRLGMIITLVVIGLIGALVTFFYVRHITQRVYKDYPNEAFLAFYGNLTGTVSTGISILREMDPNFETPASYDLVTGATTAIAFGFPILLITGFIYNDGWYWLYGSLAGLIILFAVFYFFLIRKQKIRLNK